MRYRQLGASGLRISALTMGTMTFGGKGEFARIGSTDVDEARRQIDQCLEAGINLIDTANAYSDGLSEEIVGQALDGRRDGALLATKARMPMGDGPNDAGLSLTLEEQARLEAVSRPPLLYPYWHQAKTASDRLGPADLSLLGPYLAM